MACKTSFELHHNFPKLAEESGFTFNTHKPRVHIDWNKIRLIDVDNLIRDRKFIVVEQHLNDILDCVLESEFDVRILDEGVLKIFRLAQLAVEYQQFCRHYLDRSVYVLREEVTALAQELDYTKKIIKEKEDEIRKSKRKTKYNCRNPLPYGNDNIAHVILQTLANKNDIFSTTTQIDNVHYNKCRHCDKVFMNQLYLKSHLSRRHSNVLENPQRDLEKNGVQDQNEHTKLQNEIVELKLKLKEMEVLIKTLDRHNINFETINEDVAECDFRDNKKSTNVNSCNKNQRETKDAEVSAHNDSDILEKIEEWKKEEHEKYSKEINLLRTQITSIVDTYKDTDKLKNDNKIIEELHETIKKQNAEIKSLKEELTLLILKSKNEEIDRKKEIDAQIAFWAQQTKVQSEEYKVLLQKLDTASKQAEESREIAESERKRATSLQVLLEQGVNYEQNVKNNKFHLKTENLEHTNTSDEKFVNVVNRSPKKINPVPNRSTLEKLHRRAQELLNQSLSSSDASSTNDNMISLANEKRKTFNGKSNKKEDKITQDIDTIKKANNIDASPINTNVYKNKTKKNKSHTKTVIGSNCNQISPIKVIRAKLTEEVNQRLLSFGVDPLKKSLPYDIFQKHRSKLQEKNEIKTKKNPAREKINHSIMTYLDNKSSTTKVINFEDEYISPNRTLKPFSLTSVLSNVKSKALSLVKSNQEVNTDERISYDTVSKKALALLKTPPESVASSPQLNKQNSDYQSHTKKGLVTTKKSNEHFELNSNKKVRKMQKVSESSEDCDTSTDSFPLSTQIINEISPGKSVRTKIEAQNRRTKNTFYECNEPRKESGENISVLTKQDLHIPSTLENINTTAKTLNLKLVDSEINSDDNIEFITTENELRNAFSDENINTHKQGKGVLKNASSMSSLCKKKVLFDMDAIQMKSMSESPSQSINEKSNERFEPGPATDANTEEWDISSIENELENYEKPIKLSTRSSAKIAQLKQSIESQLSGRNQNLSSTLVGAVDVLKGPMATKMVGLSGSNTSLGSSILDDSESVVSHTPVEKSKNITKKDATLSFLN